MPLTFFLLLLQDIKGANRFKEKGLEHEDLLGIMFENLHNSGDNHWCAASGVPPSHGSASCENSRNDDDNEDDEDEEDDSEPEDVTPTSGTKRGRGSSEIDSGKKTKSTGSAMFFDKIDKIMDMNERTTASCESMAAGRNKPGSSVEEVMQLVIDCGARVGTNEHLIASTLFTKRVEREMFLTIQTPEERFKWLTLKYGWMASAMPK